MTQTFAANHHQARHLTEPNIVTGLAFALGGAGQFLAGILEFCVGNTFGLTAFVR